MGRITLFQIGENIILNYFPLNRKSGQKTNKHKTLWIFHDSKEYERTVKQAITQLCLRPTPPPMFLASFLGWLLDFPLLARRCMSLPQCGAPCMDRGPQGRQGTRNQCQHRPAALTRGDASITQLLDQQMGYAEAQKSRVFCFRKSL